MALPVKTLPVVQNWDCHVTGTCCHEYQVTLSADEVARIEQQGWTAEELGGLPPFKQSGPFRDGATLLNHRESGACVFLGPEGRCRIHEKHGYEAKPLPCRLFPFVLVPAGDHWRVGLRYACPSAAGNKGRALPEHQADLLEFASGLARREKLEKQADGTLTPPPRMDNGERLSWPAVLRFVEGLMKVFRNRRDPVELRMRKALHLAADLRKARLAEVEGPRLGDLIDLLTTSADADT